MMRLSEPEFTFEQVLEACSAGITGNAELLQKVKHCSAELLAQAPLYLNAASTGKLHLITAIFSATDPHVVKTLKMSDLIKLYEQYFVPNEKPARQIYNAILNSAKERCPFCGGLGTPRTLDHFLPKARFPQFSVLPLNLVPSCRDCNLDEKGNTFAKEPCDQIIQPYADCDRFFSDQWIFATYISSDTDEPGSFEYFANPPNEWPDVDRKRANKHFRDFGLAKRYATKAAESLGMVLSQISRLQKKGMDNATINEVLLQPGIDKALFVNHWQRIMYQSLMHPLSLPT
jgi:hypothetical protein